MARLVRSVEFVTPRMIARSMASARAVLVVISAARTEAALLAVRLACARRSRAWSSPSRGSRRLIASW